MSLLAHELRTPVTALVGSSELLVHELRQLDAPRALDMASAIHRRAIWLQLLLENLLCSSAIIGHRMRMAPRHLDLSDVASIAHLIVDPLLARKRQDLRISTRGAPPCVLADERCITQALVNLIGNASKYSQDGTRIDVIIVSRTDTVRVSVEDQGPGLSNDHPDDLFAPFYRDHRGDSAEQPGLGLGLAVVRWIVEEHGGIVGAENRPTGGACFWFELPASPPRRLRRDDRTTQGGDDESLAGRRRRGHAGSHHLRAPA